MRAFELWNPKALDGSEMRGLFLRAFDNPKFGINPGDARLYLRASLSSRNPTDKLFVASSREHGLCGLAVVTLGVCALSPLPWLSHVFAEKPGAREALVEESIKAVRGAGFSKLALFNAHKASDEAQMRLVRHQMKGEVIGSLIVYDVEKRDGGK